MNHWILALIVFLWIRLPAVASAPTEDEQSYFTLQQDNPLLDGNEVTAYFTLQQDNPLLDGNEVTGGKVTRELVKEDSKRGNEVTGEESPWIEEE